MRNLLLISLTLALSGCATSNSKKYCETPVRDLTQDWHSRTYWCLPKGYVPLIDGQVTPQTDSSTWSNSTAAPLVLYTEQESLQHKARVASSQPIVRQQTSFAKSISTTQPKQADIELIEAVKKEANLSQKEKETIVKNISKAPSKEVDSAIGTEPAKTKTDLIVAGKKRVSLTDVNFRKHNLDTDLEVGDLNRIATAARLIIDKKRIIKLQGCKKDNEVNSLILGRALAVRDALVHEGVEHKIVILDNQECTTDRKVRVFL